MPSCSCCHGSFGSLQALTQHQRDAGHRVICSYCGRPFGTQQALADHRRDYHSFSCNECNQVFPLAKSLRSHKKSTGHCFCHSCDQDFVSSHALRDHMQSTVHASHFHCCDCDRDFVNQQALNQHLANKVHQPRQITAQQVGPYCNECDRDFKTVKGLRQHEKSLVHKPLSNITCPASERCNRRFISPSAMVSHLESGACRSGLNRVEINKLISRYDDTGLLMHSDTSIPAGARSLATSSSSDGIMTPDTTISSSTLSMSSIWTPISTPTSSQGTPLLFPIISRHHCPLCPQQRSFNSMQALQSHILSPAHAPKIFHCPVQLVPNKLPKAVTTSGHSENLLKRFSTLSGLVQHVESGTCFGGQEMLKRAAGFIEHHFKAKGWTGLQLLSS